MLDRTIEYRGNWWLPRAPDRVVSGVLSIEDGPHLLLDTALVESPPPEPGQSAGITDVLEEHEVIYGDLVGQGAVTFIDAWGGSFGFPTMFVQNEAWHGSAVLVGSHSPGGAVFDVAECSTDYLQDWVSVDRHSIEMRNGHVSTSADEVILFDMETEIGKYTLTGTFTFANSQAQFTLHNHLFWRVELTEAVTWRDAVNLIVAPLRDLISFGSMRANEITLLKLGRQGHDSADDLIVGRRDASSSSHSDLPYFEQLLPLISVGIEKLNVVLPRWLDTWVDLRATLSRLLAIDYAPFMYEGHRASNVLQAAEGLHKKRWNRTSRPSEVHAQIVEDALSGATEDVKEWARPLLLGKNSLSVRTRLSEVLTEATAAGFPYEVEDLKRYVNELCELRNAPAHGALASGDIERNYWAIEGLRWAVRAVLLREVGLDVLTVQSLLLQNVKLQHAARRLAWLQRPELLTDGTRTT